MQALVGVALVVPSQEVWQLVSEWVLLLLQLLLQLTVCLVAAAIVSLSISSPTRHSSSHSMLPNSNPSMLSSNLCTQPTHQLRSNNLPNNKKTLAKATCLPSLLA